VNVLVVEDDQESRDLLCEVLSASAYAVDTAENVATARRLLRGDSDYHIVIADLHMPDGNGLELLRDIQVQNSKPGVILISSYLSALERKTALELGVGAVLEKPFAFTELLKMVANLSRPDSVETVSRDPERARAKQERMRGPMNIEQKVIEIVEREQYLEPGTVNPTSTFAELGIDSLDGVNILFALEEEFKVDVPDAIAQNMKSVAQVVDSLTRVIEGRDISDLVEMAQSQA